MSKLFQGRNNKRIYLSRIAPVAWVQGKWLSLDLLIRGLAEWIKRFPVLPIPLDRGQWVDLFQILQAIGRDGCLLAMIQRGDFVTVLGHEIPPETTPEAKIFLMEQFSGCCARLSWLGLAPTKEEPEFIIKNLGSHGTADPLDIHSTIGWKAHFKFSDAHLGLRELCSTSKK